MRVLFPTAYFYPEQYASQQMNTDVIKALEAAGIKTTVITPVPTRGVSRETRREYAQKRRERLSGGMIDIVRFPMFRETKSPPVRAFRYLLCHLAQYFRSVRCKDADVIFALSTPPTQGAMAARIKKRLKIPFVYNLQDVFPDSLVGAGLTREGSRIWKIGRKIEDYTYCSADRIIVISEAFRENLLEKGVPGDKIVVIPNWIEESGAAPIPREDIKLFDELNIAREGFYITYAGNFGQAQGLETLLQAAYLLRDDKEIQFLFFGNGAAEDDLKRHAGALRLSNVRFFPLQPRDRIPEVYSLGDASVVACRKGLGGSVLPSKTWNIMAAGRPVLASFDQDGALCRILNDNTCGICVPPEEPAKLAEAVRAMYIDRLQLKTMGENGRAYVRRELSRDSAIRQYIQTLRRTARP